MATTKGHERVGGELRGARHQGDELESGGNSTKRSNSPIWPKKEVYAVVAPTLHARSEAVGAGNSRDDWSSGDPSMKTARLPTPLPRAGRDAWAGVAGVRRERRNVRDA